MCGIANEPQGEDRRRNGLTPVERQPWQAGPYRVLGLGEFCNHLQIEMETIFKHNLPQFWGFQPPHSITPGRTPADWITRFSNVALMLAKTDVAVEKGTKTVISVNFSVYGERTVTLTT